MTPMINLNHPRSNPYRKMMFFIDGENIIFRYQEEMKSSLTPKPGIYHVTNEYLWKPIDGFPGRSEHEIIRAYYYTSVTGDDNKISLVVESIKKLPILPNLSQTLYPVVFKKPKQSIKAKSVDIQMTVDILTHVYQNNVDTVCLFSGDGDYTSLLHEVIRRGKQVYIAAFSNGFNPGLKQLADEVINLDDIFF